MRLRIIVVAAVLALLSGCAPQPPQADAEWRPEKIYRTGSNIPAKDYGGENIEVGKPGAADSMIRPGTGVLGRKPGG